MSTPSEIIYARVNVDYRIGERLRELREEHGWPKPSLGRLVELLLDQALDANGKPREKPKAKPTKRAPKGKKGRK